MYHSVFKLPEWHPFCLIPHNGGRQVVVSDGVAGCGGCSAGFGVGVGRFSHRVAMSVCLFVCLSVCAKQVSTRVALDHQTYSALAQHTQITGKSTVYQIGELLVS